jgi:hypothetical protein
VLAAGGAGGGSELWQAAVVGDVKYDLEPQRARTFFNHNSTRGKRFYRFCGSQGGITGLPGEDDGMVAYHSAGGVSQKGAYGNPGGSDDVLTMQDAPTGNGVPKWNNHWVLFRDDQSWLGDYNHASIVTLARSHVASSAQ